MYFIIKNRRIIIQKQEKMLLDGKQLSQIKHQKTFFQPSLQGGYTAIYHNRIPMDIKYIDYDRNVKQIGGAQMLSVKMFAYGNKINAAKVKLQIASQYDPFLNLIFECDREKYSYFKDQQNIHSDFQEFSTVLIKCFNKVEQQCCCRTPESGVKGKLSLNLLVASDGKAKLVINQSSEYKNIEIMTLDLLPENEHATQQKVSFKYSELLKKTQQAEQRLLKIQQIIKQKNPTLLTQIFKSTNGQGRTKLNVSGI